MTVSIIRPGQVTFEKIYKGKMFQYELGVYVKSGDDSAVVIYKQAGLMNAGESEKFSEDTIVWQIVDAVFTVGEYR
jgi:hypothetical protein